jgi:hypothetical protein
MGNFAHCCILHWRGGKKTVPFDSLSNTPIFYTASSLSTYRAFAAMLEAMEAPFFRRETVLQLPPRQRFLREHAIPEDFIAEEDLHRDTTKSVDMVNKDDKTVCTSNLPSPPIEEGPSDQSIRCGPLTFNPTPLETKDEASPIAAANDQAKLMRWHYQLGHLTFAKLKQLAFNGEIPKKLAQLPPPKKCAGCLFGAMTQIPWCGKESISSHEVFVATKPGEMV